MRLILQGFDKLVEIVLSGNKLTNISMEDNSSRTSIIVAVVAIVLIVGGIFLLNQSISGQQGDDDSGDGTEVVVVDPNEGEEQDPDPTNFEECQEAGGFVTDGPPEECTYNGQTFVKEGSDTADEETTDDGEDTTNDTGDTTSDEEDAENPGDTDEVDNELGTNEFTAKLSSISGNQSSYQIVESGFPNAKYIKAGAKVNLVNISSSYGVTLTVGETYKFKADITETDSGFKVNKVISVDQVS